MTETWVKDKYSHKHAFLIFHIKKDIQFSQETNHLPTGDHQMKRQNSHLYEPPAPADIEKMRRNMILEQKAFALLKEILSKY